MERLNPAVTLMMGAGDIDRLVAPVTNALEKKGAAK
jgi:hypothetical protein